MERHFFTIESNADGTLIFVNWDLIRQVNVKAGICQIIFSETHTVNLSGDGAKDFMQRLCERTNVLNGEPIQDPWLNPPTSESSS